MATVISRDAIFLSLVTDLAAARLTSFAAAPRRRVARERTSRRRRPERGTRVQHREFGSARLGSLRPSISARVKSTLLREHLYALTRARARTRAMRARTDCHKYVRIYCFSREGRAFTLWLSRFIAIRSVYRAALIPVPPDDKTNNKHPRPLPSNPISRKIGPSAFSGSYGIYAAGGFDLVCGHRDFLLAELPPPAV